MAPKQLWTTSVNEITQIFRDALLATVPIAERAHMPWREPANYDDWDAIAQSLFDSIEIRSLEHSIEWSFLQKIPKYDARISDYSRSSFVSISKSPKELAFVCFETNASPFDTVLLARLDVTGGTLRLEREPIDSVHFVLAGRTDGLIVVIDNVHVRL